MRLKHAIAATFLAFAAGCSPPSLDGPQLEIDGANYLQVAPSEIAFGGQTSALPDGTLLAFECQVVETGENFPGPWVDGPYFTCVEEGTTGWDAPFRTIHVGLSDEQSRVEIPRIRAMNCLAAFNQCEAVVLVRVRGQLEMDRAYLRDRFELLGVAYTGDRSTIVDQFGHEVLSNPSIP